MANCHNCGLEHIQLRKDAQVDWGRAAVGWALFGVVGGAVGAVTGEKKNVITCLNCGTTWQPEQLYQILQTVKKVAGIDLDLGRELDRIFANDFITQIGPYIEAITKKEKEAQELVNTAESDQYIGRFCGCIVGLILVISTGCGAVNMISAGPIIITSIVIELIGFAIGILLDKSNQSTTEKKLEQAKFEAERIKMKADEDLKRAVQDFINNHPLK